MHMLVFQVRSGQSFSHTRFSALGSPDASVHQPGWAQTLGRNAVVPTPLLPLMPPALPAEAGGGRAASGEGGGSQHCCPCCRGASQVVWRRQEGQGQALSQKSSQSMQCMVVEADVYRPAILAACGGWLPLMFNSCDPSFTCALCAPLCPPIACGPIPHPCAVSLNCYTKLLKSSGCFRTGLLCTAACGPSWTMMAGGGSQCLKTGMPWGRRFSRGCGCGCMCVWCWVEAVLTTGECGDVGRSVEGWDGAEVD